MGTWGPKSWDNDIAADWYADFMRDHKIRDGWIANMAIAAEDGPEMLYAVVGLFVALGRNYIWPETFQQDLELAILALKEILKDERFLEYKEGIDAIKADLIELESRRITGPMGPMDPTSH